MEDKSTKKINKLASWLKKNCHKYQRFYTHTFLSSDIDWSETVAGVRLDVSMSHGYVDILGLTGEEQQALETLLVVDDALEDGKE